MRPAPGWILVRPASSERQREKPNACTVIEKGANVALQLHPGASVMINWEAKLNEVERQVAQTMTAKGGVEKLWLVREADVCALDAPRAE